MKKNTLYAGWFLLLLLLTAFFCGCQQAGGGTLPTAAPTEQPVTTDPNLEKLVISQVFGAEDNTESPVEHSYIQLYNTGDTTVSLAGAALFVRTGERGNYVAFSFPEDADIPGQHYYLIRGAAVEGYNAGNAVLRIENYDLSFPDMELDNKENTVLLAPASAAFDRDFNPGDANPETLLGNHGIYTWFIGTESTGVELRDVHIATDMGKNKVAVKVCNLADGYYTVVNLTKVGTADLITCRPQTTAGDVNTAVTSRLDEVTFSVYAGVYQKEFDLVLSAAPSYAIYYTTDGSTPTESSTLYTKPIRISDTSEMEWGAEIQRGIRYFGEGAQPTEETMPGGIVIKAIASDGVNTTCVYTNTYFVLPDFDTDYNVKVFSISLPERNWISAEGFYNRYSSSDPRPRSEAYLEIFSESGERVCHTNIEVAVSGKYSASKLMKSLRLYFKGKLNADNEGESCLSYDLFDGYARDSSGAVITEFERLLLRNGGNDCGASYIRDAFSQRLGGLLGVDHMAYTPALLFVNGEFWGMYNCRERYETQYVTEHYGVAEENVTVMESDYSVVNQNNLADYVVSDGNEADAKSFNDLYHYIRDNDPKKASVYQYITERLDIDSVIDMYVEHLILGGADWPHNNIKLWRNSNPDDPSGVDTKWHYALLDQDTTLALSYSYSQVDFSNAFNYNSVTAVIASQLLRNETFKKQFILRYYEAATEIYTEERMTEMYYEVYDSVKPLMELQAIRWPGDGADMETWEGQMQSILKFLQKRSQYSLNALYEYFGIDEDYVLNLQKEAAKQ